MNAFTDILHLPEPVLAAGGTFLFLVSLAVLFFLGSLVGTRALAEFFWDDLTPYEELRGGLLAQMIAYLGIVGALSIVFPSWSAPMLKGVDPAALSLRTSIENAAKLLAVTLGVSWLFVRLGGPAYLVRGFAFSRWRLADVLLGLLWSFLMGVGVTVAGVSFGWWQIAEASEPAGRVLFGDAVAFLLSVATTELIFRGYLLHKLNTMLSFSMSALISSALYALSIAGAEIGWPGRIAFFLTGIFYCWLFHLSRSLWLPFTFHFGWSFFQGPLLGLPVNGMVFQSCFQFRHGGDASVWITGGSFGPAAGALSVLLLLLSLRTIHSLRIKPSE